MITTDSTLTAHFESKAPKTLRFDLYTFIPKSGQVFRWTNADVAIKLPDGRVFAKGPIIERSKLRIVAGLVVDDLNVTFYPRDGLDLVNGIGFADYVRRGGFRGVEVLLEWAFYDVGGVYKGVMQRFYGVGSPEQIDRVAVPFRVRSFTERLMTQMPKDIYQPSCLNRVYDSRCGVNRSTYTQSKTVTAVPAGKETSSFTAVLAQATGYFDQGSIEFTSGLNAGERRTVRSFTTGGTITVALPFPFAIAVGDAFKVWPGCDRSRATCVAKFNNLVGFRGQPNIPVPETVA